MKKIFCLVFAVATFGIVNAQVEILPSVGVEVAVPLGDFGDLASLGIGGSLGGEFTLSDQMSVDLQAGFISVMVKDEFSDFTDSYTMIPVQAGFRYYLTDYSEGLYLKGAVGIHSSSVKTPEFEIFGVTIPSETVTSTDLSFAPTVGFKTGPIDASLRYNIISTEDSSTSYIGFRGAYVIGAN